MEKWNYDLKSKNLPITLSVDPHPNCIPEDKNKFHNIMIKKEYTHMFLKL